MSTRTALLAAAVALALPTAALACEDAPRPACEGSGCSAKVLLRDVDARLRRAGGCRVEPAPAKKAAKPVLLEMLKGKRESTVLPATAKHEAQGGQST